MFRTAVKSPRSRSRCQRYAARYFEQKTARGSRRFSCEVTIDATDRIIVDDDSMSSLESKSSVFAGDGV